MASQNKSAGRLQDKVAIVTGSSSGIGRAIAIAYAREGAKVVSADITPDSRPEMKEEEAITTLDALIKEVGEERCAFVKADMSNEQDVKALIAETVKKFGRLDIVVNNVGIIAPFARIHETSVDTYDRIMGVNARSAFLSMKFAIKQMLEQDPHSSGDRGWIINMGSIASIVGIQSIPPYSASKGAIAQLSKQVAVDYAEDRIHCNVLVPGYTKTGVLKEHVEYLNSPSGPLGSRKLLSRLGEVEDVAGPAVFLASDEARWITGGIIPVDGGFCVQ